MANSDINWIVSDEPVKYQTAVDWMSARVRDIHEGKAEECVWILQHPPLYTAGTSAKSEDLIDARFPVYNSGRGGQYTYHGPGQTVVYVMLDLNKRGRDVRAYVQFLEQWIINILATFNVDGFIREGRVGVWVHDPILGESKIAAIGVRLKKWISFHGFSLNIDPDLSHFDGIIPCGINDYGVTSLEHMGKDTSYNIHDIIKQSMPLYVIAP